MADRARFITHQTKQILLIDISNCSAAEVARDFPGSPGACDYSSPRFCLATFGFRGSFL
jgi:hypothetical protein